MKTRPQPTKAQILALSKAKDRRLAEVVKHKWCSGYNPDSKYFGQESKCIACLCDEEGRYNPEMLPEKCKRMTEILVKLLPSVQEARTKYVY